MFLYQEFTWAERCIWLPRSGTTTNVCYPSSVSSSLQAMPQPHLNTQRSTGTSSSPPPCPHLSWSATPPAIRCPPKTAKPKWCTSPWASRPDLKPRASTISYSRGEQLAILLQPPCLSYHTQVQWLHLQCLTPRWLFTSFFNISNKYMEL